MPYKLGTYRMHAGMEYQLDNLTYQEGTLFLWMEKEYLAATSWADFQERTAKPVVEAAMKNQQAKRTKKDLQFRWEDYLLYQIRFDLLRNAGIRTGELKGELSGMIMTEKKE